MILVDWGKSERLDWVSTLNPIFKPKSLINPSFNIYFIDFQ